MSRSLQKSNAHFKKAITKLPLGVSSNFRYWGEEKTIYVVARQGRAPHRYRRQRIHRLPPGLRPLHPRLCRSPRGRGGPRGQEVGGVFALGTEREYAVAEPHLQHGARGRTGALLQFRHRSRDGGVAPRARLHRQRFYVVIEGGYHGVFDAALWYTPVEDWRPDRRRADLVPYCAGVPGMLRALIHASPMNDADRLESIFKAYGHEIAAFLIEPIMGNCCSISAKREYLQAARELCDQVRHRHDHRRGQDRLPRGARRRARNSSASRPTCAPSPRPWATAIRSRCSPGAKTSCASSARASRMAAPIPRTRSRWRRRRRPWKSSKRPSAGERSRITARDCAPACASPAVAASRTVSSAIRR